MTNNLEENIKKFNARKERDYWVGERICPSCGEPVQNKSKVLTSLIYGLKIADEKISDCRGCASEKRKGKEIVRHDIEAEVEKFHVHQIEDGKWEGEIICPGCGGSMIFIATECHYVCRNIRNAIDGNNLCRTCLSEGENNPFFGKTHSKETKEHISNSRKGKGCGENNAMAKQENRDKVSKGLKDGFDSGRLNYVRDIQREILQKTRKEGKLNISSISGPEDEIANELNQKGLLFKRQFENGHFVHDFKIENSNLIIEFYGVYFHADPRKYAGDYFNKTKSLYAHQIWKDDEERKKLTESKGYDYLVIWELDWNENSEREIKRILSFKSDAK